MRVIRYMTDETRPTSAIFTIGYGGRSLDEFLHLLRLHAVACLVDVRTLPRSRYQPEFAAEALGPVLQRCHLRYVRMGDCLGGRPSDPDCWVRGKVDYERCRTKAWFQSGITRLRALWNEAGPLVLMCAERKPEACHRTMLIGEELATQQIPVRHIDERGMLRTQSEVMTRITGGQLELFGPIETATMSPGR